MNSPKDIQTCLSTLESLVCLEGIDINDGSSCCFGNQMKKVGADVVLVPRKMFLKSQGVSKSNFFILTETKVFDVVRGNVELG